MEKDLQAPAFDADEALRIKSIFRTAFPLMAGLLLEQLIGLTDVLFLGRYGEAELAAAGMAGIYVLLLLMLGMGYCVGAQSQMSRANGAGDYSKAGQVFRQSAIFLVGAGFVATLFSQLFFDPLFGSAMHSQEVRQAADQYVFWRTAALPVAYLCLLGRVFYVSILRAHIITVSSFVMVVVNCALNAVLIFGWDPFPEMGIAGAAIASALAEFASLGVLFARLAWERKWFDRCIRGSWGWDWQQQKTLLRLGRWLMLQEASAFGVWLFFFIAVERATGDRGLAVSNVVRQLGALLFLFVHAFGSTCGSIAANLVGAGQMHRIGEACRKGVMLCAAAMGPIVAIYALLPDQVLGILTDMPDVIAHARASFYVMLVSYALSIPCYFYFVVLGSLGCASESFRVTILSVIVYGGYVWFLTFWTNSTAVFWTSDMVYAVVLGLGTGWFWRHRPWEKVHKAGSPLAALQE